MLILNSESRRSSVMVLGLTALLVVAGCDSGSDEQPAGGGAAGGAAGGGEKTAGTEAAKKEEPPAAAAGPVVQVDPATAGTITGTVTFSGNPPPKPPPIQFSADPNCAAMHKEPAFPEEVVINDGKLQNVFVYVSKGLEGKTFAVPTEPVVFDQRGCQYHPHVFGVMARQKIDIINSDSTNHNVHALPKKQKDFNIGQPQKGMKTTQVFNKPEVMVTIKCEVHNWMRAYCGVVDHPYFGVTDEKGQFKIGNLPPGKYTLTAWQEKFGEQTKEIEIAPKDQKSVDFEFKG